MRGDSGVVGEGGVAGIPKFHSWGKSIGCLTLPCVLFILYYITKVL